MSRSDRRPPPDWPLAADPEGGDAPRDRFRVLDDAVLNEARRRDDEDSFPLWPQVEAPPYTRDEESRVEPEFRLDAEPAPEPPEAPDWATRAARHRFLEDPSYRARFGDDETPVFDTTDSGWPILPAGPTSGGPVAPVSPAVPATVIVEGTFVEEPPALPPPPAPPSPAEPPRMTAPAQPTESSRPVESRRPAEPVAFEGAGGLTIAPRRRAPRTEPPRTGIPHTRQTRRPLAGLAALLLLAIVSAFFGWVTAEPFWLAVGHSEHGTATVSRCTGDGLTRRCEGTFSVDGRLSRVAVPILGDAPEPGSSAAARMTSNRGDRVYVGPGGREQASVGVGLLVLCGLGIAWATGGLRLPGRRARTAAVAFSLAGPLLLFALMLGATY